MEKPLENGVVKDSVSKKKDTKKVVLYSTDEALKNLKKDVYYQFSTDKNTVKMRYQNSTNDTIYGYPKGKPEKVVKVAKKEVTEVKDRRFSKFKTDVLTYAGIGAAAAGIIYILVK